MRKAAGFELPTIGRRTRVFYGLGSVAYGLKLQALGSLLLLYFNQVVGLPSSWVGAVLMVVLIMDGIQDPLVGQWSDNFNSRWGRRHPFMYVSALPAAIAFYLLWNPPLDWSKEALTAYLFVCLLVLRLVITFYETPSAALAPELAPDYNERTRLLSYRHLFQSVGGLVMTALTYMVLLQPTEDYPNGILNPDGYAQYGLIGAVVIFIVILASTAGTHHEIPRLILPPRRTITLRAMFREMAATLSNWNFLVMTAAVLVAAIGQGVIGALAIYINTYFWGLPSSSIGIIIGVGMISTFLGVAVAPAITARFGKKQTVLTAFVLGWTLGTWPLLAGLLELAPAPGSTELLVLLSANQTITMIFATVGGIGTVSMLADVVEDSQVETGRRSEGLLLSADNVIQKSIAGLGIFMSGMILTLVGFPDQAVPGEVGPDVVRRLVLVYVPITAILSIGAVGVLSFYRIDRTRHEENLKSIRTGLPPVRQHADGDPGQGAPADAPPLPDDPLYQGGR